MSFISAVENRRSCYNLTAESPISDEEIKQIVEHSIKHAPSAFNSQSSRVILLLGEEHKALWEIVMETLRKIVPADAFQATEDKVNGFAAAYGSILFFEDQETVQSMQNQFALYKDKFTVWSEQHSGILQFIIWTALEEAGFGANLQHYNPIIDDQVKEKWRVPQSWKLIAQMPFGKSTAAPQAKDFLPIDKRLQVFGS